MNSVKLFIVIRINIFLTHFTGLLCQAVLGFDYVLMFVSEFSNVYYVCLFRPFYCCSYVLKYVLYYALIQQ